MADRMERLRASLADRYRIEREIGGGGMARVYLAEDLKHQRQVAIKVLRSEIAALMGPERFFGEIEILSRLTHPHILPLHDSGVADGQLYFVTPYAEGATLRERLAREGTLPMCEAIAIAIDVARALEFAHRRGVIHRDIKPDNILIEDGEAVVADFGVARAVWALGGRRITKTGVSVGTPAYMSPEQVLRTGVDERSDVYALGCVLYEMLAGQAPFTGPTAASIVHQHVHAPVPDVRHMRPSVPQELQGVIRGALAKAQADRYARAASLRAALEGALRSIETGAGTTSSGNEHETPPAAADEPPALGPRPRRGT